MIPSVVAYPLTAPPDGKMSAGSQDGGVNALASPASMHGEDPASK